MTKDQIEKANQELSLAFRIGRSVFTVVALAGLLLWTPWAQAGEAEVISAEVRFPEGPVWHEGKLYYVEYGGHTVMSWDGENNDVVWTMDGCGPAAVEPIGDGTFLVTCYDSNSLAKISSTGETLQTYEKSRGGVALIGPNDITPDGKGGFYITTSGPWETAPIVGGVFHYAADGLIRQLADDLHYANGIALSPDGKTLFCSESYAGRIVQFTVQDDGSLTDRREFVRLDRVMDDTTEEGLTPDGMEFDAEGNLYVGLYNRLGKILVVDPNGMFLRTIDVPSPYAPNLFFDPSGKSIYVTAVDDGDNAPYPGKVYRIGLD